MGLREKEENRKKEKRNKHIKNQTKSIAYVKEERRQEGEKGSDKRRKTIELSR